MTEYPVGDMRVARAENDTTRGEPRCAVEMARACVAGIPASGKLAPSQAATDAVSRWLDSVQERLAAGGVEPAITTHHLFHAGMYHRTILVPKHTEVIGALIKRATTLIVSGDAVILAEEPIRVQGYAVLAGLAGRQTGLATYEDTWFTMIVPTEYTTLAEVEAEIVGENQPLLSHRSPNVSTNTGVK
jgi:hypothetical protein